MLSGVSTGKDHISKQHMVPNTVWLCSSFFTLAGLTTICLICANENQGHFAHSSNPRAVSSTSKHWMWCLKEMDAWSREHRQREGGAAPAGKYGPCVSGPAHLDFSFCFHPVLTFESSVASHKPLQFEGDLGVFCGCLRKEKYFLGKYLC